MSAETIRLSDRLELVPRGNTVGYYLRRDGALTGHTVGTATADALIAACNPPTLPPHTFRLPDGELACYRRDAAKLREAGAVLRTTACGDPADAEFDHDMLANQVLVVEFPPKTERVPWHEAKGRVLLNGGIVLRVGLSDRFPGGAVSDMADGRGYEWIAAQPDGTVLVLAEGGDS